MHFSKFAYKISGSAEKFVKDISSTHSKWFHISLISSFCDPKTYQWQSRQSLMLLHSELNGFHGQHRAAHILLTWVLFFLSSRISFCFIIALWKNYRFSEKHVAKRADDLKPFTDLSLVYYCTAKVYFRSTFNISFQWNVPMKRTSLLNPVTLITKSRNLSRLQLYE